MHGLIHRLVQHYGLNASATAQLWSLSALQDKPAALGLWLQRTLVLASAALLGGGLIFWVAANWADQSRAVQLGLLEGAVLLASGAALFVARARTALLLLALLALGALLAFVGQTYQTGADAWQLFAAWAALGLPWALAARRDALWAVWWLIAALGLGLWSGAAVLDPIQTVFLGSRRFSAPTPWLWLVLFLLPLALPRLRLLADGARAAPITRRLAALLALGAWSVDGLVGLFDGSGDAGRFGLSLALVAAAAALGWLPRLRDTVALALALLALDVLVVAGCARALLDNARDYVGAFLLLTVIAAVIIGASVTWLVRLQREEGAP